MATTPTTATTTTTAYVVTSTVYAASRFLGLLNLCIVRHAIVPSTRAVTIISMSSTPILTDSLVVGASATPAALDCPERDGVLYNTDGTAFQIEYGTDRDRTFLEPGYTATFGQCTDLCAVTPECVDVTYHRLESQTLSRSLAFSDAT
jgi:hypothetical protein